MKAKAYKFLFAAAGLLFSCLCPSRELSSLDFWICQSERAEGVLVRSLRLHEFKQKKHCLVIYTAEGVDEVLAEDKWLSACQKVLQDKKNTLVRHLWDCRQFPLVYVFYPEKSVPPPSY